MTSNEIQPAPEYYVYYYENPHVHRGRRKPGAHSKEPNPTERKSRKRRKREKILSNGIPAGQYPLETVSRYLSDAGSQKSLSDSGHPHNIKPAKVRKAASIAPPLSMNPSNRRALKPAKGYSRKKLMEIKNAMIIDKYAKARTELSI